MTTYSLSHLSDHRLSRELAASAAQDRTSTATLLAHIAEFDARRLYLPAAYPSMHAYCVHELHLSEDSAFKRIRAARAAREYPAVFTAIAEGRLHLTAVVLLGPHLTPETADELLAAAAHKSKPEIEQLIAQRFPRQDMPAGALALSSAGPSTEQLVPEPVELIVTKLAPDAVGPSASRPLAVPVAQPRVPLQLMVSPGTRDKLRYAGALMSHAIPSGDMAEVLDRVLDLANRQLEKGKFAATTRSCPKQRATISARHIPAPVKRAVWERDRGQCTFTSEAGRRCPARNFLEFDHIDPVARGGRATVGGIRLRCRAHNQFEAERMFGAEFMRHKREQAREAAEARAKAAAQEQAAAMEKANAMEQAKEQDVVPWLRQLGFRASEARDAAKLCDSIPDAPLEERVRVALSFFCSRARSHAPAMSGMGTAA